MLKRPSSAIMESIRDLRTSLMLSQTPATSDGMRSGSVLVFTSSVPAEGKTTSSILLALNSAALEKKVLLVECDLRRSTFKTYFGSRTPHNLVNAIEQAENWQDAIWTRPGTNLDIIFGGVAKGRNAADIFASQEFADFIERMKSRYDLIVLDSPPVLPVPDARLIAKLSDKVIYVVRSSSTPSSTVEAGLRLFKNIGVSVDGITLTQINKRDGYGYGYGYGYGSEYYKN